jgi:hypothetical protein
VAGQRGATIVLLTALATLAMACGGDDGADESGAGDVTDSTVADDVTTTVVDGLAADACPGADVVNATGFYDEPFTVLEPSTTTYGGASALRCHYETADQSVNETMTVTVVDYADAAAFDAGVPELGSADPADLVPGIGDRAVVATGNLFAQSGTRLVRVSFISLSGPDESKLPALHAAFAEI